jgi:hypothetical protein
VIWFKNNGVKDYNATDGEEELCEGAPVEMLLQLCEYSGAMGLHRPWPDG